MGEQASQPGSSDRGEGFLLLTTFRWRARKGGVISSRWASEPNLNYTMMGVTNDCGLDQVKSTDSHLVCSEVCHTSRVRVFLYLFLLGLESREFVFFP